MIAAPTHNIVIHPGSGTLVDFECVPRTAKRKGGVEAELRVKLGAQYTKLVFLAYTETPFGFGISCSTGIDGAKESQLIVAIAGKSGEIVGSPVGKAPKDPRRIAFYHDDESSYLFAGDMCFNITSSSIDPYDIKVVGYPGGPSLKTIVTPQLTIPPSQSLYLHSNHIAAVGKRQYISINGFLCEMAKDEDEGELTLTIVPNAPGIFAPSIDTCGEHGIFSLLHFSSEDERVVKMGLKPKVLDGAFGFLFTPGAKTIRPLTATTPLVDISSVTHSAIGIYRQKKYITLIETKAPALVPEVLLVSELQMVTTPPTKPVKEIFACMIRK